MIFFNRLSMKCCCFLLTVLLSVQAMAQRTAQVKGAVLSQQGEILQGVTIVVTGTDGKAIQSSVSDEKGLFVIQNLMAGRKYNFSFSYVGFEHSTVKDFIVDAGDNNSLLIRMRVSDGQGNEVVVTALGIKRDEKSLGYAVQTVNGSSVRDAKTNNWANTLAGKVPGLNVVGTGSGPMGSARITLRGETSLNLDNNQALIVIDGVPVSSKITGTGFDAALGADSPIDYGSDVSDINPDDIEKISVLKGPAATALYGSRAAAGALIITTKSGQKKKGIGITYNLNSSVDDVNRWPAYQFDYGEGRTQAYYSYLDGPDGVNTSTSAGAGRAWGPKFAGQKYIQYDPNTANNQTTERVPWVADKDYVSGFFQKGLTWSNNLAIEGGGDKGSVRLSLTHLDNKWIIPNTGFQRTSAALSVNQKVTDKLKISGKVNYTHKSSDNLPSSGYDNQTLMYFLIIGTAPNLRPEWFKPYWQPGLTGVQQRRPFYQGPDNPYLGMYEMLNKINKHGVVGTVSATYEFTPKLDLMVRSSVDMSFEFRSQQRPYSMTKYAKGMYREENVFNYEVNTDALLTWKDKIGHDFNYSVSGGANAMRQSYDFSGVYADQLAQPGIYQISNSLNQPVADPHKSKKTINSVYGLAQLSYQDKIFLNVTGRNDWSSTLPYANCSFFYPSVSGSFLLHELTHLPESISFAKLRLSWAQVGNDTRPYQTNKYYSAIYGNSFTNPGTLYNANLKPEITSSYEAGMDLRFFKNRLGLDVSVYTSNSRNQIIGIPLDQTSGFTNATVNAGLINNKGIEVQLTGRPIDRPHFRWNTTLTWSMNRGYVKELASGISNQIIYNFASANVTIEARKGSRMGDLYGLGFTRSPDNQIIYSSAGVPAALDPVTRRMGNIFPDWKAGLLNEFTIHNFRISLLIDGQKGGTMYSQTNYKNNTFGKTKVTLAGRETGIVGKGVVLQPSGKYAPNTTSVSAETYYEAIYIQSNAEANTFDASFLKIREMRVEYNLPGKFLGGKKIQDASIALYGRDLFNFTSFPAFDPEGGSLNGGTLTPGIEIAQFPSTRNIGINLTLKF